MTVCLFVCEQDYANTNGYIFLKKKLDEYSFNSDAIKFEGHLNRHLETRQNNPNFPIYLLFHALAEVCTLVVCSCYISVYYIQLVCLLCHQIEEPLRSQQVTDVSESCSQLLTPVYRNHSLCMKVNLNDKVFCPSD